MLSLNEKTLDELIELLLSKAIISVDEGKKSDQLKPQKQTLFKWDTQDFEYTDEGVKTGGARGNRIEKNDWTNSTPEILNYVTSLDIYHHIKNLLVSKFSEHKLDMFESFLYNFIQHYLNEKFSKNEMPNIQNSIVAQLNDKPFECGARVEMIGLVIKTPEIDLHNGIVIYQTKKPDIDKEYSTNESQKYEFPIHPSAIINISMITKHPSDIQYKIMEIETILNLFVVGNISNKEYQLHSKTFDSMFGMKGFSNKNIFQPIIGLIKEDDVERLRLFWNEVKDRVAIFTSFGEKSTFRHIAYQRYKDALSNAQQIERAISDCMMGFESVFLRDSGEQQELSYRLRLRTARFFGILGFDPFKIKKMINDAYNIRSRFVHGGILDYDRTKELEEKYGSMKSFLIKLLDLLRIVIVIILLTDIGKPQMIDTIDNSFLMQKDEDTLRGLLIRHKSLVIN